MSDAAGVLDGRRVVVSLSGGKDSTALALHMRELGIDFDPVFIDTGWEWSGTYDYVRGPLTALFGPITEIRGELQMEALIEKKGMFPSRLRRFCTEELKVKPMAEYITARLAMGERLVNAIGIRHEESAARAMTPEWEFNGLFGCDIWAPLVNWSLQDVIDIHARHGVSPNPLYLKGASRVGCFPCIFARKAELRLIAEIAPERIERIERIEGVVDTAARGRYERDRAKWQETPDPEPAEGDPKRIAWEKKRRRLTLPYARPAFFQSSEKDLEVSRFLPIPIREVVDWSRTARGGKQRELFEPTRADTGCMRWGLCEAITPPPPRPTGQEKKS